MQIGERVRVQAYGGEILTRVVVGEVGDTVYISRESEYEAAKKDGREPNSVGFLKKYVIDPARD